MVLQGSRLRPGTLTPVQCRASPVADQGLAACEDSPQLTGHLYSLQLAWAIEGPRLPQDTKSPGTGEWAGAWHAGTVPRMEVKVGNTLPSEARPCTPRGNSCTRRIPAAVFRRGKTTTITPHARAQQWASSADAQHRRQIVIPCLRGRKGTGLGSLPRCCDRLQIPGPGGPPLSLAWKVGRGSDTNTAPRTKYSAVGL